MIHPIRERLRTIALVREIRGLWVHGEIFSLPGSVFELSFEQAYRFGKDLPPVAVLPGTDATYLGIWQGKRNLFEFQLGKLVCIPDAETYARHIAPLIVGISGYRHFQAFL